MAMELVRCVTERATNKGQIEIGKLYWIDTSSIYTYEDEEYVDVYNDEGKTEKIGTLLTSHFVTVYRLLRYSSLSYYVNKHIGFLLKGIIEWCINNPEYQMAEKILLYIDDNNLNTPDKMEKEFIVNSISFKDFASRGMEDAYMKYLGYSLYCID